jgi:excisionase family DNA binding protein
MSGIISARTAEIALKALREVIRQSEQKRIRDGVSVPQDVLDAEIELGLWAQSGAANGTTLDSATFTVQPFEQIDAQTASTRLGVSVRTVRKRCAAGTIPATRLGARTWQIQWREGTDG